MTDENETVTDPDTAQGRIDEIERVIAPYRARFQERYKPGEPWYKQETFVVLYGRELVRIRELLNSVKESLPRVDDLAIEKLEHAWDIADKIDLFPHLETRYRLREVNKIKGSKGGKARWSGSPSSDVAAIIGMLKQRTDALGDRLEAKELWPEFYGLMDDAGLNPTEIENQDDPRKSCIDYDGGSMTFGTFQNRLIAKK